MALGNKTLDDLLVPISKRFGRQQPPAELELPQWRAVPVRATDGLDQVALVDMFAAEAEKVRVQVHRCTTDELASCIANVVATEEPGEVVMAADVRFETAGLQAALEAQGGALKVSVWDEGQAEESIAAANAARYGITYASSGIAETGTVLQPTSTDCGRAVSLLPLVHIAVVDAASIVATMADAIEPYEMPGVALPSQLCFISGPSATADIELVRVEGVHGPMYVHYVIVG